jgi:hypothetical protein
MTRCINTLILFSRNLFQFSWIVFTVYRALLFENYVGDIYISEMLDNLSSSLIVTGFRQHNNKNNNYVYSFTATCFDSHESSSG